MVDKPGAMNCVPSKYMGNFNSLKLQDFSLPKPVIRYITKNPTTFNYYSKIVRTCKHFYSAFTVFAFSKLKFVEGDKWTCQFCYCDCCDKRDFKLFDIPAKIWVGSNLVLNYKTKLYPNLVSSLISKLHRCNITTLFLYGQTITLNEFLFLTQNVNDFSFINGHIKENNGIDLHFEKIVEYVPKLQYLYYRFNDESSDISADTVKNLLQLKKMNDFKHFYLDEIPECFNFKSFTEFMNKNKHIFYILNFRSFLSNNYKLQIQAYKNEIKNEIFEGVNPPEISISEEE